MCLLVTKVSAKSFTNERPLEYLSPNISILVNKVSPYILVLICLLIAIEVTKIDGLFTRGGMSCLTYITLLGYLRTPDR